MVVLNGGSRYIDIDTADGTVFMFDAVDGFDAFQNILDGVVDRILTGLDRQAFMAHILQGGHLADNILLCKLFSWYMAVLMVIRAVYTAVYTVIGKIQRCEHDYTVAVKILFNLLCKVIDFQNLIFHITGE